MFATDNPDILQEVNSNLVAIRKILEIQARDAITRELEKVASTPERRKMWILSVGDVSTEQIAKRVGVSDRSVQYFGKDAVKAGLLTFKKRGYPMRLIDFVPAHWEEFEALEKDTSPKQTTHTPAESTNAGTLTSDASATPKQREGHQQ